VRRVLAVVSIAVLGSLARLAVAQPAALPLELTWRAPSECPGESEVRGELSRIARARAGRTLRPLTAVVHVHQAGGEFQAKLRTELDGQAGERELRAGDCATLARSVTLVLALAFGPDVEVEPAAPPAASEATTKAAEPPAQGALEPTARPAPQSVSDADARAQSDPVADAPSSLRAGVLLSGGAELTLLPVPSPLLTAGILLELSPAFVLQLRASALPAVVEPITASADARFDGLATAALGCGKLAGVLELCGGPRVAALRARASGLYRDDSAIAPWYGLFAAAGVAWPATGRLRIGLEAGLSVSLYRTRFAAHGLATVHRAPLLAPELSVVLQLWP